MMWKWRRSSPTFATPSAMQAVTSPSRRTSPRHGIKTRRENGQHSRDREWTNGRAWQEGPALLDFVNQSQGNWNAVSGFQRKHVFRRRYHGAAYSCRTLSTGTAISAAGTIQPIYNPARLDHGVRGGHAGVRRLREVATGAYAQRAGHCLLTAQPDEVMAASSRSHTSCRLIFWPG